MESRRHAEDNIAFPLLFSPKEFFLSLQAFFSISSICFPLLYLYKKAQTTTFLIKLIKVLFFSFTYFSYFSWVWRIFYFLTFFLQGLGMSNCRVWRGPDWLIFAVWYGVGKLLMHKAIFPWVTWHHTADPIGGFLWVSFVAVTAKAVVGYLLVGSGRYFEFCLLIQLHFIFQLRVVRRL